MIEVYAGFGIADEIQIGRFYIDRVSIGYPNQSISITARNSIGKLMNEQTFNENVLFEELTLQENFAAVLSLAGVENFFVADPQKEWKLTFHREMSLFDGILQWTIRQGWKQFLIIVRFIRDGVIVWRSMYICKLVQVKKNGLWIWCSIKNK